MPGLKITITDEATPALEAVMEGLAPGRVNPVFGRACVNLLRSHLFGLDSSRGNALGGKRTHFFAQAARSASYELRDNGFFAGVSSVGIRQRFYGGPIVPRNAKFLTIPARAEACGKRAREFNNLRFAIVGGRPALVEADATLVKKKRGTRNAERGAFKSGGETGGGVMYWLVRRVEQRPDPSVMPSEEKFIGAMTEHGGAYLQRLTERRNR